MGGEGNRWIERKSFRYIGGILFIHSLNREDGFSGGGHAQACRICPQF